MKRGAVFHLSLRSAKEASHNQMTQVMEMARLMGNFVMLNGGMRNFSDVLLEKRAPLQYRIELLKRKTALLKRRIRGLKKMRMLSDRMQRFSKRFRRSSQKNDQENYNPLKS